MNEIYSLRRREGERSVYAFAMHYFPHYLKVKPSKAHKLIYEILFEMLTTRGQKIAMAIFRRFGKSTMVTTIYVAYCICYSKEKFIVIFSENSQMAQRILENVKREILANRKLQEDFPEICEMRKPRPPRWTVSEIETQNKIKVVALGSGEGSRGMRYGEHRPTLILCDDLESSKSVDSPDVRKNQREWFEKVVLYLGSESANYVLLGTVYHPFSLLSECLKAEGVWRPLHFKAILREADNQELWQECVEIKNNRKTYKGLSGLEGAKEHYRDHKEQMDLGAEVLCPEMYSYFDLYMMRDDNPISFASEMMNEPIDSKTAIIPMEILYFYNKDYASKEALLKFIDHDVSFIMGCDPSMGKATTKGDYSAIIVLARDNKTKVCYVIEADIKRRPVDELTRDILSYAARYRLTKFVIETNGFQELVLKQLEEEARKQNIYLPVREVKTSSDKIGRVQGLYKYIKSKELQFDKNHVLLTEQICTFPYNQYDDGADCLQMAFEAAQKPGEIQVWHSGMSSRCANEGWYHDYVRNFGWPRLE